MVIARKLKLYPPNKNKVKILETTALLQTDCENFWIDKIRLIKKTSIKELQAKFYYEARSKFDIGSTLIQVAMMKAVRHTRITKRKRADTPYIHNKSISTYEIKISDNNLGVTFGKGRLWFPFKSRDLPIGSIKESHLKKIDGEWFCLLCIDIKEPKIKKYKKILGIDLGLAKIAVVSDKKGKQTTFFRGEQARFKRQKYYEMRKKLQPKLKQGNVYKLLKRIRRKEHNWITDTNHKISRAIVNMAVKKKAHLAVEKLTGITERLKFNKKTRRMIKGWSFRQLQDFISYKAHLSGLEMFSVDPRGTSKTCPKCGHSSRYNRRSQERFKCRKCLYESNADRVGAMNISKRATDLLASPTGQGQ